MDGDRCQQRRCAGTIEEGYCNVCGHAPAKPISNSGSSPFSGSAATAMGMTGAVTTGTGSTPISRATKGSRRTGRSAARTTRKQLGAGLITLPDLPSTDPEKCVLPDAKVPENKRFCGNCATALKREAGFCGKCGRKYSFAPSLQSGDIVAGQYEVRGAIAYGGLGWIYLGFDKLLSRYVVLKGLLNTLDESSAAVAVAERQFLASVKHANIVGIYNFVQHGSEGFIVMEFVGGKTLKQIRKERGPLPPSEAIAYIHRILPSFGYMHERRLVYCDFKPDNVMLERDDVKLIDLGGVRRADDEQGDIYGTVGYSAPEAGEGPTAASDLFTIGRTLAVLLIDIPSFTKDHCYVLPGPKDQPLFAQQESLYRFLLRATAKSPDDRFESADEMTEQLYGVLREVVAVESGTSRPAASLYFGADLLQLETGNDLLPVRPEVKHLPTPALNTSDSGIQAITSAAIADPTRRVGALRMAISQFPKSREIRLHLAGALAEAGAYEEAAVVLKALGEEDPWDWRVQWHTGRMKLLAGDAASAKQQFDQVYFDLPGEVAPKLALALAAELAGETDLAIHMYQLVSLTDTSYLSAAFGLARCLLAKGERKNAYEALERVPQGSALYARARVEAARTLLRHSDKATPVPTDVVAAGGIVSALQIGSIERQQLQREVLQTALSLACSGHLEPSLQVFEYPFEEQRLRLGLEKSFRAMAQLVTGEERIRLVDDANAVRPRTLF